MKLDRTAIAGGLGATTDARRETDVKPTPAAQRVSGPE